MIDLTRILLPVPGFSKTTKQIKYEVDKGFKGNRCKSGLVIFAQRITCHAGCDIRLVFTFPPKDSTLQ